LQNNGKPLENFVKENHRIVKSNVAKKKIKKNICLKNLESYSSTRSSPRKNARHIRENRKDKSLWPSAGVVDSYPSIKISKNNSLRKRYRLINKRKRNSIKVAYTKIHAELIPAEKLTQSVKCIILCFYNAIVLNVLLLLPYFLHILLKQNVKTRQKLVNELWCSVPSIGRLVLEIVAYFKEWREMTIFSIIDDLLDQRSKNLFKTKFSELDFKSNFKPKQKVSQVFVFSTVRNILTAFSNFSGLVSIFYLKLVKCFPHTRLVYTLVSPFFISLNYFISLLVKVFKLSLLMFVHIWVVLAHKCASVSSYLLKFPCRVLNFNPFKINNGNEITMSKIEQQLEKIANVSSNNDTTLVDYESKNNLSLVLSNRTVKYSSIKKSTADKSKTSSLCTVSSKFKNTMSKETKIKESQITFDSEEEKTTTVELVTNNSLSFLKNK